MKRKQIGLLTLVALLIIALCACAAPASQSPSSSASASPSASASASASASKDQKFKVGFCLSNMSDAFVVSAQRGFEQRCKELGMEYFCQGASESDYTKQTPILEMMATQDPDLLVIIPTGTDTMIQPIKKIIDDKGIPFITVDTNISDDSLYISNITSDNAAGGALAADALAELIDGKGKVAIINSRPGVTTNETRLKGFQDRMAEKYPDVEIVSSQFCNNDPSTAASQIQNVLLANPDLAGVFGGNLFAAQGVANGLEAKGVDIPLVCFDAGPGQIEAMQNGTIQATVVQKPMQMGITAADYAYAYLTGDKDKIEKQVYLEPIVATQDDLDDPEISKWFYTMD
nr:ABC transporter substrate-binding protein [Maliibacterium massiliense]